jgi:chromosome segregation ATPase
MRQKVAVKESERVSRRSLAEGVENQKSSSINHFKGLCSKFEEISSSVNNFVQSKKLESLSTMEAEMDRITKEVKNCEKTLNEINHGIQNLKTQLNDHHGERTNVESNINILHVIDSIKTLELERSQRETELRSNDDYKSAERDCSQSIQKVRAFTSEKDRREGNAEMYKSQMRDLKVRLSLCWSHLNFIFLRPYRSYVHVLFHSVNFKPLSMMKSTSAIGNY